MVDSVLTGGPSQTRGPSMSARLGRPTAWDVEARTARMNGVSLLQSGADGRDTFSGRTAPAVYPKRCVALYDFTPGPVSNSG